MKQKNSWKNSDVDMDAWSLRKQNKQDNRQLK